MSKQTINLGTAPTGVGGDTPRSAFTKTQSNFDEIYSALGAAGSPLTLPAALPIAQGGTGNATGTASKLAAAAIVGPVSQSGGVPTGAIIESGSNSSGTYTKYADGTMICVARNAGPFSVLANSVTVLGPFALPAAFSATDFFCYVTTVPTGTNDTFGVIGAYPVSQTSMSFVHRNGGTAQNVINIKMLCVGRWF